MGLLHSDLHRSHLHQSHHHNLHHHQQPEMHKQSSAEVSVTAEYFYKIQHNGYTENRKHFIQRLVETLNKMFTIFRVSTVLHFVKFSRMAILNDEKNLILSDSFTKLCQL